jgi:hypothetical protein
MEQNFEDWKKENPNGSINDYYKLGNRTTFHNLNVVTNQNLKPELNNLQTQPTVNVNNFDSNLLIGILLSIIGFTGYFLPWFKLPIFNISISGNDLMQLSNFFENQRLKDDISLMKYTFIIPITYCIILLGTISKNYTLTALSAIINLLVIGFFFGKIFFTIPDLFPYLNIGIYMILFCWIVTIYYIIVLK